MGHLHSLGYIMAALVDTLPSSPLAKVQESIRVQLDGYQNKSPAIHMPHLIPVPHYGCVH